jgi:hypothetical protein
MFLGVFFCTIYFKVLPFLIKGYVVCLILTSILFAHILIKSSRKYKVDIKPQVGIQRKLKGDTKKNSRNKFTIHTKCMNVIQVNIAHSVVAHKVVLARNL